MDGAADQPTKCDGASHWLRSRSHRRNISSADHPRVGKFGRSTRSNEHPLIQMRHPSIVHFESRISAVEPDDASCLVLVLLGQLLDSPEHHLGDLSGILERFSQ